MKSERVMGMGERIAKLIEPKKTLPEMRKIFSNRDLKVLIVPLFMEQLLAVLVGVADTFMVSYAGEAAVSGVSLVNMFNTIFIYLFSALAAGGAIVVSQYIGSKDRDNGNLASGQLLMASTVFSLFITGGVLMLNRQLLRLLFGEVEPDVMDACVTYLRISAYSYPALAVYNTGAAMYRSMGKTNVTMYLSLVSNGINVAGNAIGVFNAVCYPLSGALSNGLRAAGDVKFTMYVSLGSTVAGRVLFSVILAVWMNMGVIGVALAMCLDWGIRAVIFWMRFVRGAWKKFNVI